MSDVATVLQYAQPGAGGGTWSRGAVGAFAWVLACPTLIGVPLLVAANENWLPQHSLCCRHPEVTVLAFTVMPLIGATWGGLATTSILRSARRPKPRGIWLSSAATVLGLTLALLGLVLLSFLKA